MDWFGFFDISKVKLHCLIFVGILNFLDTSAFGSGPMLKVRISGANEVIKVGGSNISRTMIGNKNKNYPGKKYISFNCGGMGPEVKSSRPIHFSTIQSPTGVLYWDDEAYYGKFHIVVRENLKGCDLINEVPLETYISTLLGKEMNPRWPIEALKAQAVAARSYAFHKKITRQVSKDKGFEAFYDLENSQKHQVNGSLSDATHMTSKAAKETEGEILGLKNGMLTDIFFHSKCGGKTLLPDQVWNESVPGYKSVKCPYCHKHGVEDWKIQLKKSSFVELLKKALAVFQKKDLFISTANAKIVPDSDANASLRFYKDDELNLLRKSRVRQLMGSTKLPSNYYQVEEKGNFVNLIGKGFGHGVGMCQYGAFELAKRGYNYRQILAHYFPEHEIKKIY